MTKSTKKAPFKSTTDNKILVNFRLTQTTNNKLEELANMYKLSKTQVIENLISSDWLKSTEQGQQKISELLDQLQEVKNIFNDINMR